MIKASIIKKPKKQKDRSFFKNESAKELKKEPKIVIVKPVDPLQEIVKSSATAITTLFQHPTQFKQLKNQVRQDVKVFGDIQQRLTSSSSGQDCNAEIETAYLEYISSRKPLSQEPCTFPDVIEMAIFAVNGLF